METSHLFNSLRTVWNSTTPSEYRVAGGKLYTFNPAHYNQGYLAMAISEFLKELATRTDRTKEMEFKEKQIRHYLTKE